MGLAISSICAIATLLLVIFIISILLLVKHRRTQYQVALRNIKDNMVCLNKRMEKVTSHMDQLSMFMEVKCKNCLLEKMSDDDFPEISVLFPVLVKEFFGSCVYRFDLILLCDIIPSSSSIENEFGVVEIWVLTLSVLLILASKKRLSFMTRQNSLSIYDWEWSYLLGEIICLPRFGYSMPSTRYFRRTED